MGSLSDHIENALLNHVLGNGVYTPPTNIYIALSTADPTDDGSGLTEPAGGSYARELCNVWDVAVSRASENTNIIEFTQATGSWGTITHFALMDAITGGNMLGHGAFGASIVVSSGNEVSILAGGIDIVVDPGVFSDYLANAILDHLLKTSAYTPPTDIYVALVTVTVLDSDTGTLITEPPANYARINHNSWDAAASGASENTGAITFVTATTVWGTIVGTALLDALTVGNVLFHEDLDSSQALIIGDAVTFADGALDITLD